MWPPVRVLWAERVAREKTVAPFEWAVARRGRVGCGTEIQARSWRSGCRVARGRTVTVVPREEGRGCSEDGIVSAVVEPDMEGARPNVAGRGRPDETQP